MRHCAWAKARALAVAPSIAGAAWGSLLATSDDFANDFGFKASATAGDKSALSACTRGAAEVTSTVCDDVAGGGAFA
jgi:hypothetical protein